MVVGKVSACFDGIVTVCGVNEQRIFVKREDKVVLDFAHFLGRTIECVTYDTECVVILP